MRKFVLILVASLSLTLGLVGSASAAPNPDNFPSNPKACVGYSSTSANFVYQDADAAKFRDEQARGETYLGIPGGELGRQDDVQNIRDTTGCGNQAP